MRADSAGTSLFWQVADGRFVMMKWDPPKPPTHVPLVLDWVAELRRRTPAGRE